MFYETSKNYTLNLRLLELIAAHYKLNELFHFKLKMCSPRRNFTNQSLGTCVVFTCTSAEAYAVYCPCSFTADLLSSPRRIFIDH